MKYALLRLSGLVILLLLMGGISVATEKTASSLTVPVAGNNDFSGTATITRFEKQEHQIVAIGFVKNATGTAFAGVAWQVKLSADSGALAATSGPAAARQQQLTRIAWSPRGQDGARFVPVQGTTGSCGALNISLGATMVNIAGAQVSLMPIGLDVSGQSGTPMGGLVCSLLNIVSSVSGLVGDVASVVNLLNSLLGSLTGALGGVTGGLGGVTGGTGVTGGAGV
jgi:hypothetical protein